MNELRRIFSALMICSLLAMLAFGALSAAAIRSAQSANEELIRPDVADAGESDRSQDDKDRQQDFSDWASDSNPRPSTGGSSVRGTPPRPMTDLSRHR